VFFFLFLTSITVKVSFILLPIDETAQQNIPIANETFGSDFNNDDDDGDVPF
jgi:hypothetical protein